jgi:hypothetical protein
MTVLFEKYFNGIYLFVCISVFVVVCLRAFFIPFSHDEASTFFFYVQSDSYLPYRAHVYTNNHVLNSALANISFHLAGAHRFVLRVPNVLAFVVLCIGVFNFFKHINTFSAKIILTSFFILTFNFLDFFELCRGYGLSIAFMVFALSQLCIYFKEKAIKKYLLFSVFWALALAANLTLVVSTTILLCFIFFFQMQQKVLFEPRILIINVINLIVLAFWIKFSFFYKSKGVLDSGVGENYWEVSFKSLLLFIFGTNASWIQILLITIFTLVVLFTFFRFIKKPITSNKIFEPGFFFVIVLLLHIIAFYLLKKGLKVNYPEDRTGLFFYVFFVLTLVFFFDVLPKFISATTAALLGVSSLCYFTLSFNLSSFTHYFYHVIPKEFYSFLQKEYKNEKQVFTIGGHPNREMNYAFMNYRAGGLLNPMDEPTSMHMNCDYYFALEAEKPYYKYFYDEIAFDKRWHRTLLKRKHKINRTSINELSVSSKYFSGHDEFFEFLRFYDSTSLTKNCIEADVEIYFKRVHKPFKAFLVLQINDEQGNSICYKRALLNWLDDDLSGQIRHIKLTSPPVNQKNKHILVYLWNIDKQESSFELKQLKILNLTAPGINVVIPDRFYPIIKKITQTELL